MTHIHNHALPLPGKDDEKYIQPMADIFKVLSRSHTYPHSLPVSTRGNVRYLYCRRSWYDSFRYFASARLLRATNLVKFTKDLAKRLFILWMTACAQSF